MSPDEDLLKCCFFRYVRKLRSIKLPVHEPEVFEKYDKRFWEIKSKAPYRWCYDAEAVGSSPWIAFVGYQIRCDGVVRIRLDSVKKHFEKIVDLADNLLRTLFDKSPDGVRVPKPGVLVSSRQALHRLKCQMISSSVGRPRINDPKSSQSSGMSWVDGYRGLYGKIVDLSQMRRFDRHRGSQLSRVKWVLKILSTKRNSPSARPKVRYQGGRSVTMVSFGRSLRTDALMTSCPEAAPKI